jgi:glycosyltransferase involved in cell wall biosynthesis
MSQALRILYVSSEDVSRGDGPGVNEREFIRTLHRMLGDRAHFVIPRPAKPVADLPESACTFYKPHHRHHPLHYAGHLISQARTVARYLSSREVDLLVLRLDLLPLAMRYLVARHEVPYAIKTLSQGTLIVLEERSAIYKAMLSGLNTRLNRHLVSSAITTDVCSQPMIEYFVEKLRVSADKFVWIDNAVDTSRFLPTATGEAKEEAGLSRFDAVVGYIGSQPSERGAQHLVESAPRLLAKHPGLGVVIVGDGPGLDTLRNRSRELGVASQCVFTGQIPFDEVPLYCNALDVGVSISYRDDRFAAAELKVRQYLACGKPVVASPGSNEFLRDHDLGSIVDASSPTEIEKALDHWLSLSVMETERFRNRAREFVCTNLSYEAAVQRRLRLWSSLIHDNGASTRRDALQDTA